MDFNKWAEIFVTMMDKYGLRHITDLENGRFTIDEHFYIETNRHVRPYRCTLYEDGKEVCSSNPSGILLIAKEHVKKRRLKNVEC